MGIRAIIILLYHVLGNFCFTPYYETINFCSKTVNSLLLVVYLGNVSGARRSLSKTKIIAIIIKRKHTSNLGQV